VLLRGREFDFLWRSVAHDQQSASGSRPQTARASWHARGNGTADAARGTGLRARLRRPRDAWLTDAEPHARACGLHTRVTPREDNEAACEGGLCHSDFCLMYSYAIRLSSDIDQHPVRCFLSRVAKEHGAGFASVFTGCCSAVCLAKNSTA